MTSKIVDNLRRRTIKTFMDMLFMDMLILAELQEKPLSGYDIIGLVHKRFNVLVRRHSLLFALFAGNERLGCRRYRTPETSIHLN